MVTHIINAIIFGLILVGIGVSLVIILSTGKTKKKETGTADTVVVIND